ncbi:MAG: histidine phosphatase family protein [Alcaligenaceae bacterium]|nr:histidine phosphatase family protein [Alcaligenaceae bacterium]
MSRRSTDLLIIRHGETDWNALQRLQGWSDIILNETGKNQAEHLNNYLQQEYLQSVYQQYGLKPTRIYASDLQRAIQTAHPLANDLSLEIQIEPDLRERNYGKLEGKNWREALNHHDNHHHVTPMDFDAELEVERLDQFAERLQRGLNGITQRYPGELVVVISHGGALDMMWRYFKGLALDSQREVLQRNTTINHVRFDSGVWELIDWGHKAHLETTL